MKNLYYLSVDAFQKMFSVLQEQGFVVQGPTLSDDAIVMGIVKSIRDLPQGWTQEVAPGVCRLKKRSDSAFFGYQVGSQSLKKLVFPPREKLWQISKIKTSSQERLVLKQNLPQSIPTAVIGLRACDLVGLKILDAVFEGATEPDQHFQIRRENLFLIAVQCTACDSTCFCTSMGQGAEVKQGYDWCLTEVIKEKEHYFLLQAGSEKGEQLLATLDLPSASQEDRQWRTQKISEVNDLVQKNKGIDPKNLQQDLYAALQSPIWEDIATRCLSCANCTLVCPTCFCSNVEDVTDLKGEHAERWKTWDSCFTGQHSYIHGGQVHASTASRYRQWATHKLASWWEQFDMSGCSGCGRCIAWCPVGIDLREEVTRLRQK